MELLFCVDAKGQYAAFGMVNGHVAGLRPSFNGFLEFGQSFPAVSDKDEVVSEHHHLSGIVLGLKLVEKWLSKDIEKKR